LGQLCRLARKGRWYILDRRQRRFGKVNSCELYHDRFSYDGFTECVDSSITSPDPDIFFWNAGTDLQRRSLGPLQSLFYQMLNRHREVICELIKSQDTTSFDDQMPIWTEKRLESSLRFVIDRISPRLCFFTDGLDEFDECEEDVLELISDLQNKPYIRICLSSCP
jgi:hypothetical protein